MIYTYIICEKIKVFYIWWKGQIKMKKIVAILALFMLIFGIFASTSNVYAYTTDKAIDNTTESKIIEIKETQMNSLDDYKAKYGSDVYGIVAYILNLVRIYSIPFCFLGIAAGAVHRYIIGIRKLDTLEKGMGQIVTFVTILVICQVLPLAFAMFVRFGRG